MKIVPHNNPSNRGSNKSLISLRDAINHLFEESMWNPYELLSKDHSLESFFANTASLNRLSVDFSESEQTYTLVADVPGFSVKELSVELQDSVLIVSGEKTDDSKSNDQESKDQKYHLQERSKTQFRRSILLPEDADLETITCDLENATLTIQIAKTDKPSGSSRTLKLNKK